MAASMISSSPHQPARRPAAVLVAALAACATLAALASPAARADQALAQAKACMACHTVDQKRVGPSFKDVAARYAGQPDAAAKLAVKIRSGGKGVWGAIPMPANSAVSEADARKLAEWVLTLK